MENFNEIPKTGTIGGMVDNINANFQLTKEMLERLEVTKDHAVGLFSTLASLQAAYPTPEVGDWALVGDTTPFAIYKCTIAGTWSDTGGTYDGGTIDLSDYVKKEEFATVIDGGEIESSTDYSIAGYIKLSDGSIVTGNTWIHSDLIPLAQFVQTMTFKNHASVAIAAYYDGNGSYISGQNGFNGAAANTTITKAMLTIPSNAVYVAFSTDGSLYTLTVDTVEEVGGIAQEIANLDERVAALEDGSEIVNDLTTGGTDKALSAEQGKVIGEILNGASAGEVTETFSLPGYIRNSDGVIVSGTWVHSDLIPWDGFVKATRLAWNGSVASVAFYNSSRVYIGGINSGTGIPDPTLKSSITAPDGTAYVAFSTDGSRYTLAVTYIRSSDGLVSRVQALEQANNNAVKFTPQTLTESQKQQARENIGVTGGQTEDVKSNKFVHFSLDDCTFWADLITNESNYSSCFQNPVLARLKTFHDTYGHCYTLNCFIVLDSASIANVPSKWASEFAANKDWLRFAFHGTSASETFVNTDASVLKGYYDTFVAAIFQMTGTYDCIDRITRLSSYSGNSANIAAIRDTDCGIVGLLTNDRDVSLSAGNSYYLSAAQNAYIHNHDKMLDATNFLWFIRTVRRLENATIAPSVLNTAIYANFRPIVEIFWHETSGWATNYAFNTWLKDWFDWLQANDYVNKFTSDLLLV